MKKVYLLCLLFCISIAARAQVTTVIYASGALGSYTTGSAFFNTPATYTRADNVIAVTNPPTGQVQRGYAVFDLSAIPTGATVSQVILGLNVNGFTLGTFGNPCLTIGRAGSLATVTTASTLYADCVTGTTLWSAAAVGAVGSYGSGVGGITMASTPGSLPAACFFVQTNAGVGNFISIGFSEGASGSNVYNFKGETGSLTTAGGTSPAAPYLQITYCYPLTNVTASVTPTSVCTGQTFTLTGVASGATTYRWYGPGGFSSTSPITTSIATATSGGTYRFVAYANCGTFLDSTSATTVLTVNPSPATLVTTTTTVCSGNTIYMSDQTAGGVWSSSNTLTATVNGTGAIVAGGLAGTDVITYKLGICAANATIIVNNPPTAITGPTEVCESGGQITLVDGTSGGTWTSTVTTRATIDPLSGLVTGILAGADNISYVTGACPSVNYPITVDPLPTAILGGTVLCANGTLPLSDATVGGTWSSSNTNMATIDPNTGLVTGVSSGGVTITYMLTATGCYVTRAITINPIPAVITGSSSVCIGFTIKLSDATGGGTWSSSSNPLATVGSLTGIVTGVTQGTVNITYTVPVTGCFVTQSVTVAPLPVAITGPNKVCVASTITLNDATIGGSWSTQFTALATIGTAGTGDVTGVSAGTPYISYSIGTGCYVTFTVTVNPLPTAVITPAGPTTFCGGGSVTLNATVGAGYLYQWFSNGNPIPLATASSYVANSTELITLQVTDGNGCVKISAGTQVTLIPNVTIAAGGPTVFCQPGNVLLSVPLAPGIIYQWILNGVNITGANSNTYAATVGGIYTCYLSVPGGCNVTTPPFTVTVHAMPNPTVYYTGTQLTTPNNYLTYQWFLNTVAITGATTNSVTPTVNGSYQVRVTDGNGCTGYSAGFVINNLAVEQINKTAINIYPNPANTVVHIVSPVSLRAVITSIEGKTLMEEANATDLDISKLPDGLYMIMLYDKNGERLMVQKLIKE